MLTSEQSVSREPSAMSPADGRYCWAAPSYQYDSVARPSPADERSSVTSRTHVNSYKWGTNLIGFNALNSYVSPSYYVQKMLADSHGDQVLPSSFAGTDTVNSVVTNDSSTGKIYITLVNPSSAAQTVNVNLSGAGTLPSTGTATTLSSASGTDTNSISDPDKITPSTASISGVSSVPAYSVTVLTLG